MPNVYSGHYTAPAVQDIPYAYGSNYHEHPTQEYYPPQEEHYEGYEGEATYYDAQEGPQEEASRKKSSRGHGNKKKISRKLLQQQQGPDLNQEVGTPPWVTSGGPRPPAIGHMEPGEYPPIRDVKESPNYTVPAVLGAGAVLTAGLLAAVCLCSRCKGGKQKSNCRAAQEGVQVGACSSSGGCPPIGGERPLPQGPPRGGPQGARGGPPRYTKRDFQPSGRKDLFEGEASMRKRNI